MTDTPAITFRIHVATGTGTHAIAKSGRFLGSTMSRDAAEALITEQIADMQARATERGVTGPDFVTRIDLNTWQWRRGRGAGRTWRITEPDATDSEHTAA